MMREGLKGFLGVLICIAWVSSPLHAGAYHWRDEQGIPHYSDIPPPDGHAQWMETIQDDPAPRSAAGAPPSTASQPLPSSTPAPEAAQPQGYTLLEVLSPSPDETLRNDEGTLSIALATEPELHQDDRIAIYLDGVLVGNPARALQFQVHSVERGTHTLEAKIIAIHGEILKTSASHTFHMFRPMLPKDNPKRHTSPAS